MGIDRLLEVQGGMFLFLLAGYYMKKSNIILENGEKTIANILLEFILPCSIIHSFESVEFSGDILRKCWVILVIAILIQLIAVIFSRFLYHRYNTSIRGILEYGTLCSNAGLMGSPIAESVFGGLGMMYSSIYLIPQRIVMWTLGLTCFNDKFERKGILKKIATNPCILAVLIGLALMVLRIKLPPFLSKALASAGGCTTPLSMIFLGSMLVEVKWDKDILEQPLIYYSAIRLFAFPFLVFVMCKLLMLDPVITGVSVLLTAMPAGSTVAILASRYECDTYFAVRSVMFTTVCSLITVPLWCYFL